MTLKGVGRWTSRRLKEVLPYIGTPGLLGLVRATSAPSTFHS